MIELLVVVTIIGILSTIAIPQFSSFRRRGYDARAISDLRGAATAEEAVFGTADAYLLCVGAGCNHPTLPGFQKSDRVQIIMLPFVSVSGEEAFFGLAWSNRGSGEVYAWRSDQGGML